MLKQYSYITAKRASGWLGNQYQKEPWFCGVNTRYSDEYGWFIVLKSSGGHSDIPSEYERTVVVVEDIGYKFPMPK
jgi:hypothetical protein